MKCKIAIWGAGKFGQYVCNQLKKQKDNLVVYFIDKNPDLMGKKIIGVDVVQPEYLQLSDRLEIDYILVAFMDGVSVYNQLSQFGSIKVGIVKNCVINQQLELKEDLRKDNNIFWVTLNKPLLKYLETNIVDHCNLNCKGCSHFSNLYHVGDAIPFDIYCKDLEQISRNVNLFQFRMLGGEVLLNERLIEYITFTRKVLPYTDIWLVTNGLLLPRQKKVFFQTCRNNNIKIEISEYKPTLYIKSQIIELLNKYEIPFSIIENLNDFGKNIDLSGNADKYEAMERCREHGCHFFRNGKLHKCPFEALGNRFFEYYQLDASLQGGADIYDRGLDWGKLIYQLDNHPIEACRYCGNEIHFKWEVSSNPTVKDWIV